MTKATRLQQERARPRTTALHLRHITAAAAAAYRATEVKEAHSGGLLRHGAPAAHLQQRAQQRGGRLERRGEVAAEGARGLAEGGCADDLDAALEEESDRVLDGRLTDGRTDGRTEVA